MLIDTVSVAFYSTMMGKFISHASIDKLGGKNKSSDAVEIANESTFSQAHGYLMNLMGGKCERNDYGTWWSEYDSMWQNDELSEIITTEAALFASKTMILACMADALASNLGFPLDFMPWCVGSGGSTYPMNGHVDNDNIVQANATSAYRLIYKLNRIGMICDPYPECGCMNTPVWIKTHYKLGVVRPGRRGVHMIGFATKWYDTGLNPAYEGELGSNDEFLWVAYRRQRCCTCCE